MTTHIVRAGDTDTELMSDVMILLVIVMMTSVLSTLATQAIQATQAAQSLQAQSFTGLTYSRTLHARSVLQWENLVSDPPYAPLVSASFHNDGPRSAFIAINNPDEHIELLMGDDYPVDMLGSDRRIEFIFYRTIAGTASIRVVGKY